MILFSYLFFIFLARTLGRISCRGHCVFVCYLSTLRAIRLRTVMPTEVFCMKGNNLQRNWPSGWSANGNFIARSCTQENTNKASADWQSATKSLWFVWVGCVRKKTPLDRLLKFWQLFATFVEFLERVHRKIILK